jgi:DNA-binding response OmpR family regulator
MDELQQFFKDSAADQLHALERLSNGISRLDPAAIEQVRRIAHNLKGSGASYGFPEVSEAAAAVVRADDDSLGPIMTLLTAALASVARSAARQLVLVVDDDPLITRLLEARLTTPGRRVATMTSIAAARQFVEQTRPDLILLDLFLPDGDGRTFLTEIHGSADTAATPVVVISSADSDTIRDEVIRLGADGFIGKPFHPDEVVTAVAASLKGSNPGLLGRTSLTSTFRNLSEGQLCVSIVAAIPETHGPGGTRNAGPDAAVSTRVLEALSSSLGRDATVAEWTEGEVAVVSATDPADLARGVDRARLRLRTSPHPTTEGALISFSAAIVTDDGRGLADAYHRAHRFALDANQQGGDRVSRTRHEPRGKRVLLAEDDTLTAALIIHRLEREGFEVEHHPDGRSALDAIENGSYGIVILDVQLPGMDGFEVLGRLRAMHSLDDTPIVMLTAVGGERDVVRGFDLGASDYILKPFSPAELTARIKRFVSH